MVVPPFEIGWSALPLVTVALHAGHDVRPEVAARLAVDDAARRREEDPGTERAVEAGGMAVVVHRSRFEVDLNRPRDRAVYTGPERRSNVRVGGQAEAVKVTDGMLALVEAARPELISDGMFLVGLDIVGDRLVEVNVFSPGGLGTAGRLYGASFVDPCSTPSSARSPCGPTTRTASRTPASRRSEPSGPGRAGGERCHLVTGQRRAARRAQALGS